MKNIRVDVQGRQRCWKCGGLNFTHKRTARSKAIGGGAGVLTLGIAGAATPLVTKKKLKCQACGAYNDVGNAQVYKGPQNKYLARRVGTHLLDGEDFRTEAETLALEMKERLARLEERLQHRRESRDEKKAAQLAKKRRGEDLVGQESPNDAVHEQVEVAGVTAQNLLSNTSSDMPAEQHLHVGWHADPYARAEFRYWDGSAWSGYVATGGTVTHEGSSPGAEA